MFQGDSITDAGRDRSDNHLMSGYTSFVKDALKDEFEFLNFGISGDTSRQLLQRHKDEISKVKPDVLVLLIGINDVWRHVDNITEAMTTHEEFIKNTLEILKISKEINPNIKIIYIEPFLIRGTSEVYERGYDYYLCNMKLVKENVPPLVDYYVSLQDYFLSHTTKEKPLLGDGVHPDPDGQKIVAARIIDILKELN